MPKRNFSAEQIVTVLTSDRGADGARQSGPGCLSRGRGLAAELTSPAKGCSAPAREEDPMRVRAWSLARLNTRRSPKPHRKHMPRPPYHGSRGAFYGIVANPGPCAHLAHLAARSICLMSHGKIYAARLGRRPEGRHRTGSPRRFVADALCGGCDVSNCESCALIWRDFRLLATRDITRLPLGRKFFVLLRVHGGWVNFAVIPALPVFNVSKTCSPRCAIETIWGSYSLWAIVQARDRSNCRMDP